MISDLSPMVVDFGVLRDDLHCQQRGRCRGEVASAVYSSETASTNTIEQLNTTLINYLARQIRDGEPATRHDFPIVVE
jgi:hypothetical protein